MGYRAYIGFIPRKEWQQIKDMSLDELFKFKGKDRSKESEDHINVHEIAYNEVYGFGKYANLTEDVDFKAVFTNSETQQHFNSERDFQIVDKDFMESVINLYSEKVRSYYSDMLEPFKLISSGKSEFLESQEGEFVANSKYNYSYDFSKITQEEINSISSMMSHIQQMAREWGVSNFKPLSHIRPYNLKSGKKCSQSNKYEYTVFELVNIYKNFDWEHNVMIYCGY